ncbi:MAG TPA: UTP--glucose-1-phosphate uridylyltransferase [Acidimicrobiales bacterium]|nr:UTP--glucose-1-phosphate uridylyltransferase [Acidimicrobiales bacterium]
MSLVDQAIQQMTGVTKAVIPAAGWGTRLLPATKAIPKEMVPVMDRPVIQWAVEEAARAGLDDICIVTSRSKSAIEDHFDTAPELEEVLERKDKAEALAAVRRSSALARLTYTRQASALGLGHAVAQARDHVGGDPFAVLLPDVVLEPGSPALTDMVAAYKRTYCSILALVAVPPDEVSQYGCAAVQPVDGGGNLVRVTGVVEKPMPDEAPSNLTLAGRYVLTPSVMEALGRTTPSAGGEIQLTDAIDAVIRSSEPVYGLVVDGGIHDTGSVLGLLEANLSFALFDPTLGQAVRKMMHDRLSGLGVGE